jgi:acetyltransferase-like isoleucine patch superfamily enzyme
MSEHVGTSVRWALFVSLLAWIFPSGVRCWMLRSFCGYSIAPGARIGRSLIGCPTLRMEASARVGHFNTIKGMRLVMEESAGIGDFNWISGLARDSKKHFLNETDREPLLHIARHASLTSRHFLDCCNRIFIGEFSTVAGARSQILTHAIDFQNNRQVSAPVQIGRYCFIGTGSVVLKGAKLPDYSILAANSSLTRAFEEPYTLYSGVPAVAVKALDRASAYFHRDRGYVD